VDPSILQLAEQGGPWAWAVLVAAALLWLPTLGLATTAATGRRVPTAAFLALVTFLLALATVGTWLGMQDVRHALGLVGAGEKVQVAGQGLELAWIPVILAGRLAPALCTVGALAVAIGAWLRAPVTRFSAPRHAIAPVLLGMLGAGVGALVDERLALAAIGAVGALAVVSIPDDDEPLERQRLAARRTRVAVLGLSGMVLALAGAIAAALGRADGLLALTPWPPAETVAFYTADAVLERRALLPGGLAPLGLVGLAGLASVLPVSARLGGWRTWLGGTASAVVTAALLALVGGISWMHQHTWSTVLPPSTQVAVPRVERVLVGTIEQSPPWQQRLTWTPRGVQIDGLPVRRLAVGAINGRTGPHADLEQVVAQTSRARVDQRYRAELLAPWDLEIPAVALARDVRPVLRVLLDHDADVSSTGVELVVVGSDGYPGTVPVQLRRAPQPGDAAVPLAGDRTWDEIIRQVEALRRADRAPVLVLQVPEPGDPVVPSEQ